MRYIKAADVLPEELLREVQQYADGAYLYIPRLGENRLSWGDRTRSKEETARRNRDIYARCQQGETPQMLAKAYFLTEKTIRRIILAQRKALGGEGDEGG